MNLPQIQKIMMEFEKQNEMMGARPRLEPLAATAACRPMITSSTVSPKEKESSLVEMTPWFGQS